MVGPCLCGDIFCPSCGDPYMAKVEAAEEWTMEQLAKAKLTPEEYRTVVSVGLRAVKECRKAAAWASTWAQEAYTITDREPY